jgi:hypothetical protein
VETAPSDLAGAYGTADLEPMANAGQFRSVDAPSGTGDLSAAASLSF